MSGLQRATVYGFSLWEMEVFGACPGTSPTPPTTTPPTTPPTQPPGTYPGWAPNTAYAVGARVSYSGLDYQCLQAHTSIVSWEPPYAASLWQRL
jgi:chitodextrinase